MSGLEKDKEISFFNRSLENLKLYEEQHANNPETYKYEVTMMLNSLLGILVVLKERTQILDNVDISFLEYSGTTKNFFRHMRNSISHGHFINHIKVDVETKEIAEIEFVDKCPACKKETFSKKLSVSELKTLIDKISEVVNGIR